MNYYYRSTIKTPPREVKRHCVNLRYITSTKKKIRNLDIPFPHVKLKKEKGEKSKEILEKMSLNSINNNHPLKILKSITQNIHRRPFLDDM